MPARPGVTQVMEAEILDPGFGEGPRKNSRIGLLFTSALVGRVKTLIPLARAFSTSSASLLSGTTREEHDLEASALTQAVECLRSTLSQVSVRISALRMPVARAKAADIPHPVLRQGHDEGAGLLAGQEPHADGRLPVVAGNGRTAKSLHLLAHVEQRPQGGDVPILGALRCGVLPRGAVAHEVRGQVVRDDVAC